MPCVLCSFWDTRPHKLISLSLFPLSLFTHFFNSWGPSIHGRGIRVRGSWKSEAQRSKSRSWVPFTPPHPVLFFSVASILNPHSWGFLLLTTLRVWIVLWWTDGVSCFWEPNESGDGWWVDVTEAFPLGSESLLTFHFSLYNCYQAVPSQPLSLL